MMRLGQEKYLNIKGKGKKEKGGTTPDISIETTKVRRQKLLRLPSKRK